MAGKKRLPEEHVTRHEFDHLVQRVDDYRRDLDVQFQRIAQIQAELDHIRAAWNKRRASPKRP